MASVDDNEAPSVVQKIRAVLQYGFIWLLFGVVFAVRKLWTFFVVGYKVLRAVSAVACERKDEGMQTTCGSQKLLLSSLTRIRLNVGGKHFEAAADTLRRCDCMFRAMLESDIPSAVDADGRIVIDRDGTYFEYILNFLRMGSVPLPSDPHIVQQICCEAKFYHIPALVQACDDFLNSQINLEACERAVFTTEERDALIAENKPVIFFSTNSLLRSFYASEKSYLALANGLVAFVRLRATFPQFVLSIDQTPSNTSDLSFDFFFDGQLIERVKIFANANNQCLTNVDAQLYKAMTSVMSKVMEKHGYGQASHGTPLAITQ